MELHEYARHDAVGLRDLIKAGDMTAVEVETVARRALELANAEVNGLALPLFPQALDHAADGPFAGVPYLIKDSGPMAKGVPFFLGSRAVQGAVAPYDTDLMTRFRAAGLATLGLTTVPELVISFSTESLRYGPTRNPRDLERGVGGSSGGAAALVAGHLLEEMGHAVTEASPAVDWDAVMRSATTEAVSIVAPVLMAPRRPDPARMEAVSRELIRVAEGFSALELMAGLDAQNQVTRSVGTFFTAYDLLFQVAARLEEAVPWRGRTPPVSVTRSYSGGHV